MSRQGCELCEALAETLREVPSLDPARVEIVDIDSDPALQSRYHYRVPVLLVGETEVWAGPARGIDALCAALAQAGR
jgi:hypothetical protein